MAVQCSTADQQQRTRAPRRRAPEAQAGAAGVVDAVRAVGVLNRKHLLRSAHIGTPSLEQSHTPVIQWQQLQPSRLPTTIAAARRPHLRGRQRVELEQLDDIGGLKVLDVVVILQGRAGAGAGATVGDGNSSSLVSS